MAFSKQTEQTKLSSSAGVWTTFRWTEAVVDGGPVLGRDPAHIATFAKGRQPADVHVGRAVEGGWEVRAADLVEPIAGTLVRLLCTPREIETWQAAGDPVAWSVAHLAAKEAVRAHLRESLGRDVHPASLRVLQMRPDRFVVVDASALTAQEQIDHLGPTRFHLRVDQASGRAVARVVPV